MSVTGTEPAFTALRSFELRTSALPLDAQMVECVDLLQAPEFVIEDLVRSVSQVRASAGSPPPVGLVAEREPPSDPRASFFYPCRELFVKGDRGSFTCLATTIAFQEDPQSATAAGPVEGRPIDYAAVTCEAQPRPVLGFVQSAESESAYPLLLRALSTLIELPRPGRLGLLNRKIYRGLLRPKPVFDLALVLWDDGLPPDERRPLCELSRDLAEVLKRALLVEAGFPPILKEIVCLRMNPERFDGRLRYVWRV